MGELHDMAGAPREQGSEPGPTAGDGPTDGDFAEIERAVRRTRLGNWFLNELQKRAQSGDMSLLLAEVRDLRAAMDSQREVGRLEVVQKELQTMAEAISQTRQAISSIKPEAAGANRIMAATEELDAIVTATERATSDILGAAETIQRAGSELRAAGADSATCDQIEAEVTDIFTACTFQDITGQRTTKVVNVLRYLEQRVHSMIEIWGVSEGNGAEARDPILASGPARPGEGVSQDDVDRMLSSFGEDAA